MGPFPGEGHPKNTVSGALYLVCLRPHSSGRFASDDKRRMERRLSNPISPGFHHQANVITYVRQQPDMRDALAPANSQAFDATSTP